MHTEKIFKKLTVFRILLERSEITLQETDVDSRPKTEQGSDLMLHGSNNVSLSVGLYAQLCS